jgi:UDP-N-acetylglucosamine 2-epimerase (non-hydrolysing)
LLKDGVKDSIIFVTGNTVIDSLLMVLRRIDSSETDRNRVLDSLNEISSHLLLLVEQWENVSRKLILITCHRRENFGQGILELCNALENLAKKYPNIDWVYPVHLNPNISEVVYNKLSNLPNIHLIPPMGYEVFVFLMSKAHIILTDSGGIQEEAPSIGKPVLVMRDHSERPEALAANTVKLIGMKSSEIIDGVKNLFDNEQIYSEMVQASNPYGNGESGAQIIEIIKHYFKG